MSTFPGSVIDIVTARMGALVPGHVVIGRSLRSVDPHQTIGVFAGEWRGVDGSDEMGGTPAVGEPTLGRYTVTVQNLVKSPDEEVARRLSSVNSKIIRAVLYRDSTLKVSLAGLSEDLMGRTERYKRHGINRQRYLAHDLPKRAGWAHLTSTELWIETETS